MIEIEAEARRKHIYSLSMKKIRCFLFGVGGVAPSLPLFFSDCLK